MGGWGCFSYLSYSAVSSLPRAARSCKRYRWIAYVEMKRLHTFLAAVGLYFVCSVGGGWLTFEQNRRGRA